MCTAQNLLQRFFYRKSLTKFDAFSVAMACMLLAMKIEEDPRSPRAVVLVFHRMFERRIGVEPSGVISPESMKVLKDEMLRVELHVLKELGFGFYNIMDHPHKFILYYLKVLELDFEGDVSQRAWNYVNDSLRTDLSLRFRSEMIACAAIYMASRSLGIKLPDNPPWWVLFNADLKVMGEVCNTILALYQRPKVTFLEPLCEGSIFKKGGRLGRDAVNVACEDALEDAPDRVEGASASALSETRPASAESGVPQAQDSAETATDDVSEPVAETKVDCTSECVSEHSAERADAETEPKAERPGDGGVSGGVDSPRVASLTGVGENNTESNGVAKVSRETGQEQGSETRSRSQSRSRSGSKSRGSDSSSRSAPGTEREDGPSEANNRPYEREQPRDRERDRKRSREQRRREDSRSRSRDRNSRRRDSSREGDRERARNRERDRGRGKEWDRDRSRDRNRDRDRRRNRGDRKGWR